MEPISRKAIQKALIHEISNEMDLELAKINPEMSLRGDLGIESLDAMNIVMALEDVFHKETELDEILECETVNDLIDYLEIFLNQQSS
ncbi:acyl carrier protein [Deltaproteobacteria bacterium TL4]